jgi:hypothetical protein
MLIVRWGATVRPATILPATVLTTMRTATKQ